MGVPTICILGYLAVWLGSFSEPLRPLLPAGMAAVFLSLWCLWRGERADKLTLRLVIGVALVLRVLFLPVPPSLSTDVYRYLWDGVLALNGINPFLYKPVDPALAEFQHLDLVGQFNSPEYYSVYPPVMQITFLLGGWGYETLGFSWGYVLLKLALGGCELGALWVLAKMLPVRYLILYAWNPLVVVEAWGQPHGEAIAIGAIAGCLWFATRRPVVAVFLLTVATWAKLWPVLLFPFLFRHLGWHWRYFLVAGSVTALLWVPYASLETFANFRESLKLYTHKLEWNAAIYELLYLVRWAITKMLWGLGWLSLEAGHGKLTATILRWVLFAGVAAVFWWGRRWSLTRQFAVVSVLFIITLSIIHPWYLLPVYLLLPMFQRIEWSWVVLGITSAGTYLAYTHASWLHEVFMILGWSIGLTVVILEWRKWKQPPFSSPLSGA